MGTLKDLSIQRMVALTEPWLDPKRDRPKLEALPSGKALLPKIEAAYQGLLSTQKQDATTAKEVAKIQNKQAELDVVHDRKLRGTYYLLTALAELSDDEEQEAALLTARDELAPNGLSATQRTYAEEAGEIPLAKARLSAKSEALLKKVPVLGGKKLSSDVDAWFDAGKDLGALEEKRRALETGGKTGGGASRAEALRARNYWIKVVRHLETSLDLDGADELTARAILGPVRDAEKSAGKRGRKGDEPETPESSSTPPDEKDT
jgi:hypothetical protein